LEYSDYNLYRRSLDSVAPFINHLNIMGEYAKGRVVSE
jgi:hypothetical protein